jgi:hypothetical protein
VRALNRSEPAPRRAIPPQTAASAAWAKNGRRFATFARDVDALSSRSWSYWGILVRIRIMFHATSPAYQ